MLKINNYIEGWKRRNQCERATLEQERKNRIIQAKSLAKILIHEFKCKRVYGIGSLFTGFRFSTHSDADIVVQGLEQQIYFKAYARLMDEISFPLDLIRFEEMNDLMREIVKKEGVTLDAK